MKRQTPLPAVVRRDGAALLHQQLWCWGCDIRRAEGNLLSEYGFQRHRPPQGEEGSTAYALLRPGGACLILWGFGVFFGDPPRGGLFLKRYGFSPELTPAPALELPLWDMRQLPPCRAPSTRDAWRVAGSLLIDLLGFIRTYECWARATVGPAYREECVGTWDQRVVAGNDMEQAWGEFAARCALALRLDAKTRLVFHPSTALIENRTSREPEDGQTEAPSAREGGAT